ncbi:carbonic anhydrase [Corynebacterium pseudopelargi]|nr:carbonic anhydrase [Corynebacterium pseudopelargi]
MSANSSSTLWNTMLEANQRFAEGTPARPNQDEDRRAALQAGQNPYACVFTCSDSRVPAELIFDAGLGDLFVVRTAGEVVDIGVMATLEFAVAGLGVELLVIMGHQNCGAVKATAEVYEGADLPPAQQRVLVEQILPSITKAKQAGMHDREDFERQHAARMAEKILSTSSVIREAVEAGRLNVVAARYKLDDATVETVAAW